MPLLKKEEVIIMNVKSIGAISNNSLSLKKSKNNSNVSFKANYVPGFRSEVPLTEAQLGFVTKLVKQAFSKVAKPQKLKKLKTILAEASTKISDLELVGLGQKLKQEPIGFSKQNIKEIKKLYSVENSEFLDKLLTMRDDRGEALLFKDPNLIVQLLTVHKRHSAIVENIIYSDSCMCRPWSPEYVLNEIMYRVSPEDPDKIAYFSKMDPQKTIQGLYDGNRRVSKKFTMQEAKDLAYTLYGIKS